jgi:trigger factor
VNLKVELLDLAPCKKQLRFELPAEDVDAAFADTTKQFQKQANLPGFRKGKAPLDRVRRQFGKDIETRVRERLLNDSYRQGIEDNQLKPILDPEVEEINFKQGEALTFIATMETAPDFELPEYKGLSAQQPKLEVTDRHIENALNHLRDGRAEYRDQDRAVQDDDQVKVSFTGTIDGQPLTEFAPTARGMTEQSNMPLHVHADAEHDHFIPGFTRQLIGAKKGDALTVEVTFPDEFPAQPKLQGLSATYQVTISQIKEKVLPDLNDEFAKSWEAESLEKLREGVRDDLEANQKGEANRLVKVQVQSAFAKELSFAVPETFQQQELRNAVNNIVRSRRAAGESEEGIEQAKDQITAEANAAAIDNLRWFFAHKRIAENEKLEVSRDEILGVITIQAQQMNKDPKAHIKELTENNQIGYIQNRILEEKVIDLMAEHATITEIDPPAEDDAAADELSHGHSHG